ncbi:MAG: sugar phosphate nucleotidyltransferase [Armatimonadota bacterium]
MKGVVRAGGLGTRLRPLTKVINKHLLPVGPYPMIYYPIGTLVEAGIRDLMIVTGGNNAGMFLELLGNGKEFGLKHIHYAYQDRPGGIAHALSLARDFVEDDRCIVMLGDNLVGGSIREHVEAFRRQPAGAKILLTEVEDPSDFGVADVAEDGTVKRIVEKPKEFVSRYAVIGVYMYDALVWEILTTLKPSGRGELEITDVSNAYLERGLLTADILRCEWGDCGGSPESLLEAAQIAHRTQPLAKFNIPVGENANPR